ncbi:MAG TPA: hypothetical protein VMV58_02225 [Desulfosporosinus sp.]|nr:hypothetical protein [Desulfosporosinus sp.]
MRLTNMKALFKNLLSSFTLPEEAPLSETERLLAEIEKTREKMIYAWNRLDYAAPEYVEIAVLELLLVEMQYEILHKRYRLTLGLIDETPYFMSSTVKALSTTLERNCQSHTFYESLINSVTESLPLVSATLQLMSPNPYQS